MANMFDALSDALRKATSASSRAYDSMPNADDPVEVLVNEALWALYEVAALRMVHGQRDGVLRASSALLLLPPNENEREVLRRLVVIVRGLPSGPLRTDAAVDPAAASSAETSTRDKESS